MYPKAGRPSSAILPAHTANLPPSPRLHTAETIDRRSASNPHASRLKEWASEHQPANRAPFPFILCRWITAAPLVDLYIA